MSMRVGMALEEERQHRAPLGNWPKPNTRILIVTPASKKEPTPAANYNASVIFGAAVRVWKDPFGSLDHQPHVSI